MPREDLLDELTDPQREAVTAVDGPLLVLAGAGSGKTRVITRRAAYIAQTSARSDRILAITFTNKAAGEMRERIGALGVAGRMWICTFHALCARLLREYGSAIGIEPTFSIFDDADMRSLAREAIRNCDLNTDNWNPRTILSAISRAKMKLQSPADFENEALDFSDKTIARCYEEYQNLLRRQNACDFDDLLMHVARLLDEHDDVRNEVSDRFHYLLIDEYQDTNRAQYLIAARIAQRHRNICATGDPDQSIYAWRGADIRNILDFEAEYPDAKVVRLEQNFRSTGAILSAASALISKNRRRKHKKLWTKDEWGADVRVWQCDDDRHEAEVIADDMQHYCSEGGRPGNIAIFYRVNAMTRVLEDALRKAGLPYQIARGVEFYARKEIKDVLAYLRLIANPADDIALVRAINTPARGIGKITINRLQNIARRQGISSSEAVAKAGEHSELKSAHKKLCAFAKLIDELCEVPTYPVNHLVDVVLKKSGIERSLLSVGDVDNEPLTNIYELVTAARQYDQENPEGSLAEWLQQISLVSDLDGLERNGGAITLMTLHAAKGLEFPVVYIVGLEEGLLPHSRTLRDEPDAIEEERRLAFVGMTRSQQRLTLSQARYRMVRGITERTVPSRFLRELPSDEIDRKTLEDERDRSRSHLGRFSEGAAVTDDALYPAGQRVRHEDYGIGEVLRLEQRGRSTYIRIHFQEHGERAFALEHVGLYILDE